MGLLDICDSANGNNTWFVAVLIGVLCLNLVLSLLTAYLVMVKGGVRGRGGGSEGDGGIDDIMSETRVAVQAKQPEISFGSGGNMKSEMLAVQKALTVLERKIDNKKVNEITATSGGMTPSRGAGYLLHNAHDTIGNNVPTAGQTTLEQISSHQSVTRSKVEEILLRMGRLESQINKLDRR